MKKTENKNSEITRMLYDKDNKLIYFKTKRIAKISGTGAAVSIPKELRGELIDIEWRKEK